jgi:hypothetical protein
MSRPQSLQDETMKRAAAIVLAGAFAVTAAGAWEALPVIAPAPADNPTTEA